MAAITFHFGDHMGLFFKGAANSRLNNSRIKSSQLQWEKIHKYLIKPRNHWGIRANKLWKKEYSTSDSTGLAEFLSARK